MHGHAFQNAVSEINSDLRDTPSKHSEKQPQALHQTKPAEVKFFVNYVPSIALQK